MLASTAATDVAFDAAEDALEAALVAEVLEFAADALAAFCDAKAAAADVDEV
ncbi:hypothetical protein ACPUER_11870 [Burkholderia sp. DN3021]|uniref:hypothetical protein n=1 Tax=Burkholderia sp. DN3021 TaxID=3410137 RepID=UPI003C7A0B1C